MGQLGQPAEETYSVRLTEPEIAAIAKAMTAFFNVMAREQKTVSEQHAALIVRAMVKMKEAISGTSIVLVQG